MNSERENRRELVRLTLGSVQMLGAAVSFCLLLRLGLKWPTLICFAITTCCTVTSQILFRDRWWLRR